MNYSIPTSNLDSFEAKIEKLNKRAKKLKMPLILVQYLNQEIKKVEDQEIVYQNVSIVGEAPKINGWSFICKIEHLDEGNILRAVPTADTELVASYANAKCNCNHCKKNIKRNITYLLLNDKNVVKQVGKTCLIDFIGHSDPHTIAEYAEIISLADDAARNSEGYDGESGGKNNQISLFSYLKWVHASIRKYGWVSKGKAQDLRKVPTAVDAYDALQDAKKHSRDVTYTPDSEDEKRTELALEWIQNYDSEEAEKNNYMHNLKVTCSGFGVRFQHLGYAASLFVAYDNAMGKTYEKKEKIISQKVGSEGEKIIAEVTVIAKKSFSSDWGAGTIYTTKDAQGNKIKWFNGPLNLQIGENVKITAKVKKHEQFDREPFNKEWSTLVNYVREYVEKPVKVSKKKVSVGV